MNLKKLQLNDPGEVYYNLRDKLSNHVTERSEEAFKRAASARESIKTKEEFEEYIRDMRTFFIDSIGEIPYDSTLARDTLNNISESKNILSKDVIIVYETDKKYIKKTSR